MPTISLDHAWAIIAGAATPLNGETISLNHAAGRVLAAPVVAAFESPRANVSMMDGFAVHEDDAVAGALLRVVGISAAGARSGGTVGEGQAVRIFTGAALPEGADRVIIIHENVEPEGDRARIVSAPRSTIPTISPTVSAPVSAQCSAMVTARLLLAPLVAGLLGQRLPAPLEWIDLPLAAPLPATGDRETFVRAMLVDGRLAPLANQDSGGQRALAEAGWLLRCPAGQGPLDTGTRVSALAF